MIYSYSKAMFLLYFSVLAYSSSIYTTKKQALEIHFKTQTTECKNKHSGICYIILFF